MDTQFDKQKNTAISRIRTFSIIAIVMVLIFGIGIGIMLLFGIRWESLIADVRHAGLGIKGPSEIWAEIRVLVRWLFLAIILLISAALFIRITKQNTPFIPTAYKYLRGIGWMILLKEVVCLGAAIIVWNPPYLRSESYYIREPLLDYLIGSWSPLLMSVIECALVLIAAEILRYGAMLQKESDETL